MLNVFAFSGIHGFLPWAKKWFSPCQRTQGLGFWTMNFMDRPRPPSPCVFDFHNRGEKQHFWWNWFCGHVLQYESYQHLVISNICSLLTLTPRWCPHIFFIWFEPVYIHQPHENMLRFLLVFTVQCFEGCTLPDVGKHRKRSNVFKCEAARHGFWWLGQGQVWGRMEPLAADVPWERNIFEVNTQKWSPKNRGKWWLKWLNYEFGGTLSQLSLSSKITIFWRIREKQVCFRGVGSQILVKMPPCLMRGAVHRSCWCQQICWAERAAETVICFASQI
jgi:hypothetical protein